MSRNKKAKNSSKENAEAMSKLLDKAHGMQVTPEEQMAQYMGMQGQQLGAVGEMLGGMFGSGQQMSQSNPMFQMMGGDYSGVENPFANIEQMIAKYGTPKPLEQTQGPSRPDMAAIQEAMRGFRL
jgi:hypothetical protein